jgi:hypothetical protein
LRTLGISAKKKSAKMPVAAPNVASMGTLEKVVSKISINTVKYGKAERRRTYYFMTRLALMPW